MNKGNLADVSSKARNGCLRMQGIDKQEELRTLDRAFAEVTIFLTS